MQSQRPHRATVTIPEMASKLLRELNLLRKDSRDAGLDQPAVWRQFISWEDLQQMAVESDPARRKSGRLLMGITKAKSQIDLIVPLECDLSQTLDGLQVKVRALNTLLRKLIEANPEFRTV